MVYVEVPSGTAIITGDAAYIAAINVGQQVPFGYYINLEDVMAGLRRIAKEGKHVLPTHDAEVYKLYPEGIR
jgi:glyoxylase-like metal-dependent hydrolase (beta-lactamase superfamily II)